MQNISDQWASIVPGKLRDQLYREREKRTAGIYVVGCGPDYSGPENVSLLIVAC